MKKIVLGVGLLIATSSLFAQKVSEKVSSALKSKYAGAASIEWSQKGNNFSADFVNGEQNVVALFDNNGTWLESLTTLSEGDLPENVNAEIGSKFEEYYFDNIYLKENSSGLYQYEIEISTDESSYKLVLDKTGKILKEETVTYNEGGDDW